MPSKLSGEEKAAILLRAIGEDSAAEVMRHLSPKEIRKVGQYMAELSNVSREQEAEVIQEYQSASGSGSIGFEGKAYIKSILSKAMGADKANQIMESLTSVSYPGLESLKWLDARTVAQLVKVEHPQTIAVILANLDADQASQVLASIPEHLKGDVALRLATMQEVQPEMLEQLSHALQESLQNSSGTRALTIGGATVMADILARLDKNTEANIMTKLAESDPALAETIRSLMFVFDDLIKIDDRGIQELLKEISKEDLPIALRAASPDVREKILRNMSSRAAEMLKEDMDARGPVKLSEVEKAQQNILKLCRKLEEEGRVVIGGQGGEVLV
ncbi:MAG TPA: flagellar motor switch protein FliG [Nitrospiraceae bacterium]|nr:flagellar motor switch protein FliG [Nitrospiraceae bacterium]